MSPYATTNVKKFPFPCPSAPLQLSTPQKPPGRSRWGASPTQPILSRPFPDHNTGFGAPQHSNTQQSFTSTHSQGHAAQSVPQDFGAVSPPSDQFSPADMSIRQLASRRFTQHSDPQNQIYPGASSHIPPPSDRIPNEWRPSPFLQLSPPSRSANDRDGNGCSQQ